MDYSVKLLNAEYSSLLEGYSGLFIVRLANLCVKSNPISLIPVIVDHPLGEKNIEEVADASVPDDDHIIVMTPYIRELIEAGVKDVYAINDGHASTIGAACCARVVDERIRD